MAELRTVLVTGSTDGIGVETALALASEGLRVIVHGRNRPRVDAALAKLHAAVPGGTFEGVSFDLGSLAAVGRGAASLAARFPRIDVLIHNAGIFASEQVFTEDGVEATLAVNYLAPFVLTARLLASVRASGSGTIIHVSSIAHTRGRIQLGDLSLRNGWSPYAAYAQSKLAQVMHTLSLAEREPGGVEYFSLHPGVVETKLLRQGFGPVRGISTAAGASTSVALATGRLRAVSGSYFSDGVATPPAVAARDKAVRDQLWAQSEIFAEVG